MSISWKVIHFMLTAQWWFGVSWESVHPSIQSNPSSRQVDSEAAVEDDDDRVHTSNRRSFLSFPANVNWGLPPWLFASRLTDWLSAHHFLQWDGLNVYRVKKCTRQGSTRHSTSPGRSAIRQSPNQSDKGKPRYSSSTSSAANRIVTTVASRWPPSD